MLWTIESHSKEFKGEQGERKGEFNYSFSLSNFLDFENSEFLGTYPTLKVKSERDQC